MGETIHMFSSGLYHRWEGGVLWPRTGFTPCACAPRTPPAREPLLVLLPRGSLTPERATAPCSSSFCVSSQSSNIHSPRRVPPIVAYCSRPAKTILGTHPKGPRGTPRPSNAVGGLQQGHRFTKSGLIIASSNKKVEPSSRLALCYKRGDDPHSSSSALKTEQSQTAQVHWRSTSSPFGGRGMGAILPRSGNTRPNTLQFKV